MSKSWVIIKLKVTVTTNWKLFNWMLEVLSCLAPNYYFSPFFKKEEENGQAQGIRKFSKKSLPGSFSQADVH